MRARSGSTTRARRQPTASAASSPICVDGYPTLVIDNCTNKGTVVSNMNGNCFIGGIAGVNYAAAIRDCANEAEVKFVRANAIGAGYLCISGGIAGQTYSGARSWLCQQGGRQLRQAAGDPHPGGIVGTHNASTIDDCSNSGDATWPIRRRPTTGRPQAASWVSTARTARR